MKKKNHNPNSFTFEEHLQEVKRRLLIMAAAFILFFVVSFFLSPSFLQYLLDMGTELKYSFIYISPEEILMQQLKIAFIFALVATAPVIIFQGIRFISPVFEKKRAIVKIICIVCTAVILLVMGMLFAYKILLPFMLTYLKGMGDFADIPAGITVENYISLVLTILCIFGILFEIPLIVLILSLTSFVTPSMLWKGSRFIIVLIFIIAAIVTPPDVISQLLVAIPLVLIFYLSIVVSYIVHKLTAKK